MTKTQDNRRGAYLFNYSLITRTGAPALRVECYAGDILAKHSDVLLISAFKGHFFPVPNTILGAIQQRFGLSFGSGLPAGAVSVEHNLHRFPAPACEAFSNLWVLEILSIDRKEGSDLPWQFDILRTHVKDIVSAGVHSIALPLLGTGSQGLDIRHATFETLKLIRSWTAESQLEIVRVFAYDFEKIAILNQVIGEFFNTPTEPVASALLSAATDELKQKIPSFTDEKVREGLTEIWQLASAPNALAGSIATRGRIFAEECCKALYSHFLPGMDCPSTLGPLLYHLQPFLTGGQTWILAYLRLLQFCGNAGAHHAPVRLTLTDAAAVVVSVIRVAEFISQEQDTAS